MNLDRLYIAAVPSTSKQAPSPKVPYPSSSSSSSTDSGPKMTQGGSISSTLFLGPAVTSSSASSSSPRSEANTSHLSLPEVIGIKNDSKKPQYTTIAANPLYTSYRDGLLLFSSRGTSTRRVQKLLQSATQCTTVEYLKAFNSMQQPLTSSHHSKVLNRV